MLFMGNRPGLFSRGDQWKMSQATAVLVNFVRIVSAGHQIEATRCVINVDGNENSLRLRPSRCLKVVRYRHRVFYGQRERLFYQQKQNK